MNREKLMYYIDHPEALPERAYCLLPSDNREVIIVVNGEKGYYPYKRCENINNAENICKYYNITFGVSEEQVEALMILSMRGA